MQPSVVELGFTPKSVGPQSLVSFSGPIAKTCRGLEVWGWSQREPQFLKGRRTWCLRAQDFESNWAGYPGSAVCLLCGLGQIGWPLCALLSFSVKWK